jgi:hypothetical protein
VGGSSFLDNLWGSLLMVFWWVDPCPDTLDHAVVLAAVKDASRR